MATEDGGEGRRRGPVPGVPCEAFAVRLPRDLGEWGKGQPGGLSALLRRLLGEAREAQAQAAEAERLRDRAAAVREALGAAAERLPAAAVLLAAGGPEAAAWAAVGEAAGVGTAAECRGLTAAEAGAVRAAAVREAADLDRAAAVPVRTAAVRQVAAGADGWTCGRCGKGNRKGAAECVNCRSKRGGGTVAAEGG